MLRIVNPATEELIAELEPDDPAAVADKYDRARAAQPRWRATPMADRLAAAQRFADLLAAHKEELAGTLTDEMGKPLKQARNEIAATPERVRFFVENTPLVAQGDTVFSGGGMTERVEYEPLGVVANISAWNYPYFVSTNVVVPALLTGNTVLFKPSEYATQSGLRMVELLHEAGVPEDVLVPVVGDGKVGAEVLQHPVDGVFFTGSYATGRKIAQAVAPQLLKLQLELGGKDPAYACDDVDVPAVADALTDGAFYNTGQSCCSVERIYVHDSIHDAFVDAFLAATQKLRMGNPRDDGVYIGPLTRPQQRDVLQAQVDDAIAKGATLLCGGQATDGPGYFFEPTVLINVNRTMAVMRDESFGPIIGIQRVADDDEAIALMNDTEYGLTASVYTPDRDRAVRILSMLDVGTVYWNCCDRVSPRLPWSGRKHSGLGITLSLHGIGAFLRPKAWHLRG